MNPQNGWRDDCQRDESAARRSRRNSSDILPALVKAERTTPHRSVNFEKYLAAVEAVASHDGTFSAARVRAFIGKHAPELIHYNSGCVYRWLLDQGRAVVVDFAPLNNVEHRKINTPAPVYRLAVA